MRGITLAFAFEEDELEALLLDRVESLALPSVNSCFGNSGTPVGMERNETYKMENFEHFFI